MLRKLAFLGAGAVALAAIALAKPVFALDDKTYTAVQCRGDDITVEGAGAFSPKTSGSKAKGWCPLVRDSLAEDVDSVRVIVDDQNNSAESSGGGGFACRVIVKKQAGATYIGSAKYSFPGAGIQQLIFSGSELPPFQGSTDQVDVGCDFPHVRSGLKSKVLWYFARED